MSGHSKNMPNRQKPKSSKYVPKTMEELKIKHRRYLRHLNKRRKQNASKT